MATEDTERSKRGNQHHGLLKGSRSARREAGFTPSTLLYLVVRGSSRRDQISTVAWEPTRALVRGHRPEPPPLTCVVFALDISSHTLTRSSQPASLPGSISFLSLSLSLASTIVVQAESLGIRTAALFLPGGEFPNRTSPVWA